MATIILTGGGTAGHCIPHLSILPYLKEKFDKIYYIGSANGIEKNIISNTDIPYYSIPCEKLRRSLSIKNLIMPMKIISGIVNAKRLIEELKPDVIFSKGGFVSVPTVIAGNIKKIPVISHESDYTIGLANKITAKYCDKVLTSFPETAKNLNNGLFVGPPIRNLLPSKTKKEILDQINFKDEKPVLLITGGSQGSKAINKVVKDALNELLPNFNVIHICGKSNLDLSINRNGYYQCEFYTNMEEIYSITSVCISRAGSNTVFELMYNKIPTILIPLPKDNSRGDQILNAEYFQKKGLAFNLYQKLLTVDSLIFAVNSVYSNRYNLNRSLLNNEIIDSSKKIAEILSEYIR